MNDYTRRYEWGGFVVRKTAKGWTVSGWSRTVGERTDYCHFVKPGKGLTHDLPLGAPWNDSMTVGDTIAYIARYDPDKVLRRGQRVA